MPQVAHFLLVVMSLQRTIILNLKKLTTIYEAGLEDSVGFLASSFNGINNNMLFRDDSPVPSSNSSSNDDEPSLDDNWAKAKQTRRIMALIDKKLADIQHEDGMLTHSSPISLPLPIDYTL